MSEDHAQHFQLDIEAVQRIPAIPSILDVVCRTTGMGFAAVARVTEDRWIACEVLDNAHFGVAAGSELKVETTFCNEVRTVRKEIVIDHVAEDPDYADHPTPRLYGLQSYISVPIILPDGSFFGTLCALDARPGRLKNAEVVGMFRLFAELIAFHLDANDKLTASRAEVESQRVLSELREQFIAVLGHDLRNPLASIRSGTGLLSKEPQTERSAAVIDLMRKSVDRMSSLIDNVLDFARGRLGGGLAIARDRGKPLGPTLEHVLSEMRSAYPDRRIEAEIDLHQAIDADHERIGQLFSNLLGNAVIHGDPETPVRVNASIADGHLELTVCNGGDPIPPLIIDKLFDPFTRGDARPNRDGLGLGLYIASQIAKAHDGRLDVVSDDRATCFTFRMPVS